MKTGVGEHPLQGVLPPAQANDLVFDCNLMEQPERRLSSALKRGLSGDQAAYREFLSAASALLRRYIERQLTRLARTDCDTEDIVQEALLAIHSRIHTYDSEVPVTAWIHAIARYKMIDLLRATTPSRQRLSLDEIKNFVGDTGAEFDTALALRKVLDALPARLRIPIELMKLGGFSVAETAARTGMSEAAVKVYVHRGLKLITRMLG